jgi:hypothetical protein
MKPGYDARVKSHTGLTTLAKHFSVCGGDSLRRSMGDFRIQMP